MIGVDEIQFENKLILPQDIQEMSRDQEVIVNRIQINTRLIEIEAGVSPDLEKLTSLRKAVGDIKRVDRERRGAASGAKMKVDDILKVFGDIINMPNNSFERI